MESNIHRLHSHSKEEMELIDKLVHETKRRYFLEIGAYHFELSEYFLGRLSNVNGKLCSVDWKSQLKVKSDILEQSPFFKFIQGDSRSEEVIARVKKEAGKDGFDIVLIDAGHTFPMVQADTKNYADLVADDGYIMWHDACSRIVPFIADLNRLNCPIEIYNDSRGLAYIKGDKWKAWKQLM